MAPNERPKILIADDDEDILVALERALEDEGYATTTAVNHEEASNLLSQETFDLLVLDDSLSDKDSIEVLMELRHLERMPLVVVTFHSLFGARRANRLRLLGVSAFVSKRAQSDLVEVVHHLLEPRSSGHSVAFDTFIRTWAGQIRMKEGINQ